MQTDSLHIECIIDETHHNLLEIAAQKLREDAIISPQKKTCFKDTSAIYGLVTRINDTFYQRNFDALNRILILARNGETRASYDLLVKNIKEYFKKEEAIHYSSNIALLPTVCNEVRDGLKDSIEKMHSSFSKRDHKKVAAQYKYNKKYHPEKSYYGKEQRNRHILFENLARVENKGARLLLDANAKAVAQISADIKKHQELYVALCNALYPPYEAVCRHKGKKATKDHRIIAEAAIESYELQQPVKLLTRDADFVDVFIYGYKDHAAFSQVFSKNTIDITLYYKPPLNGTIPKFKYAARLTSNSNQQWVNLTVERMFK